MSAFSLGVAVAGDGSALASRLFSARGRFLAGELPESATASYLSGLLVGAEIGALWPRMRVEELYRPGQSAEETFEKARRAVGAAAAAWS